jgi:hypothetical protein
MIIYEVNPGDLLGVLAVKFKTTIQILMNDNPIIPPDQSLKTGWKLTIYEPLENAQRFADAAYKQVEDAHALRTSIETNEYLLGTDYTPVTYKNRTVSQGQIGYLKTLKETPLLELQANGYVKTIRQVGEGELLKVYGVAIQNEDSMFVVDAYRWVTSDPEVVIYEEIPKAILEGKYRLANYTTAYSADNGKMSALNSSDKLTAAQSNLLTPQTWIGSGTPVPQEARKTAVSSFPTFKHPGYKRPVMQLKNAKGETTNIELRVLGFNASYQNNVQANMTNAGWMINVRASNLSTLTISGILLETKGTNEFDSFMDRYYKYLTATKTDDYYSMGISTLFYKQTQYQGVVVGFSYSDQEVDTFHRKYTMQMLVLKEKRLSSSEISAIKTVVSRRNLSEAEFRSDLGAMLANSITGTYYDI